MPFGNRLKEARIMKGMTQEELAHAVGVTKGAIGNYESEVSSPKENILIKLMKVLNVDANFLFQDLIGPGSDHPALSPEEEALVAGFRSLSPEGKKYMLQTIEMAVATMPANKNVSDVREEKLA